MLNEQTEIGSPVPAAGLLIVVCELPIGGAFSTSFETPSASVEIVSDVGAEFC